MPIQPKPQPPYYEPSSGGTSNSQTYKARLEQGSTAAPIATVFENTLPGPIIWARTDVGTYTGTLTGAFTLNKTYINLGAVAGFAQATWNTANAILIETYLADFTPSDDIIANVGIEITVYP